MQAAKKTSGQKPNRLEADRETVMQTMLNGMREGMVACDHDGTIVLFNKAAEEFFGGRGGMQEGASLYKLCLKSPVEFARDLLQFQQQHPERKSAAPSHVHFINATTDQEKFLHCRLTVLTTRGHHDFLVIFFEDVSPWYSPDNLFFNKIDEFRGPMTNLRASIENITEHPEMSPVMRTAFENVLVQESLHLTEAFSTLDKACSNLVQSQRYLIEINAARLFDFIARHFVGEPVVFAPVQGKLPAVKVDTYGLLLALRHLTRKIRQKKKVDHLDCAAHTGEHFAYFDFSWTGKLLPMTAVESLLQERITESVGGMTVAAILHTMGGDVWSQQHDSSRSILRLALPIIPEGPK